jgi:hypothetical protein
MVDRAVIASALHVRWMDASLLQRGIFSPLRVDPRALDDAERRLITLAFRAAHGASGARGLGGPGACPGVDSPPATRALCAQGDLWEMTGIGWLRLGVIAELVPAYRQVHHFASADDATSPRWADPELPAAVHRIRQNRSNGAPLAGVGARTNFGGEGPSAAHFLQDRDDLLAPPRLFFHLRRASLARTQDDREHHLALALLCTGALLHVAQDLSTPAHARGDATAFFAPLSKKTGDRGLPLQEFARVEFGRARLPAAIDLAPRSETRPGSPLANTIAEHLLGSGQGEPSHSWEGMAPFTARRFLSESTLPRPQRLADDLSPSEAARRTLDKAGLGPQVTEGAVLSPWPADRGYVRTQTGRVLAAFDTDLDGRVRLYLDRATYRSQAAQLIPRAVDVSLSLLEHLWPVWPGSVTWPANGIIELDMSDQLQDPVLFVLFESEEGERRVHRQVRLRGGQANRVVGALPDGMPENKRVVLVLTAERVNGEPVVLEQTLGTSEADETPARAPVPPARAIPDVAEPTP